MDPHSRDLRRGRLSEPGRIYLVTTVTRDRRPVFSDLASGRIVVHCLRDVEWSGLAETLCFVVMPDNLHWLLALDERKPLSRVVQVLKNLSARRLNALRGEVGPVWQAGFHDHALRAEEDVVAVARDVVANPVRAGLVQRVGEYALWDARWL
jgi:REP element-mobilizing transposase RayT